MQYWTFSKISLSWLRLLRLAAPNNLAIETFYTLSNIELHRIRIWSTLAAVYQWVSGVGSTDIIHGDPVHPLVMVNGVSQEQPKPHA